MRKVLAVLLCGILLIGLVGCSTKEKESEVTEKATTKKADMDNGKENVKITFLNTKGEIQAQLEEVAAEFTNDTGIELEVIPTGAGTSPFEKMTALYASGNAPTLSMMDVGDLAKFEEKMTDLSSERWVNDAMPGSLEVATISGKLLAFPFAVEGFGLIYNQTAIENATGKAFDPAAIKTRGELEGLFEEIKAGGLDPMIISPLDWSLGAHYTALAYGAKGKDLDGIIGVMDSLKAGEVALANDDAFNNLMDTFDLLAEYNIDKEDPLSGTYDTGAGAVATGKTAFWFMGNWAWPQIKELSAEGDRFGFIPVPIDLASETNKIAAGPTKYVAIDQSQNSEEQVAAARKFLEWIVYEENGQKGLVEKCSIIPAFLNIDKAPDDDLAKSILGYMAEGETIPMVLTFPADYWKEVGAYMQKYLAGYGDRSDLYSEIEEYWKNVK